MNPLRNGEAVDPRERYVLYRLCDCPTCDGKGKARHPDMMRGFTQKCTDCRGEGKVRQELATCESPEAVGVAIVTLGREGEWNECAIGCLDRMGEVGQKWIVRPWLPSPRNASDAGRLLGRLGGRKGYEYGIGVQHKKSDKSQ